MTFLIKRGKAAVAGRCHAHLARYGATGQIVGAWCREKVDGDWISSNVPWGLKVCKHCNTACNEAIRVEASR